MKSPFSILRYLIALFLLLTLAAACSDSVSSSSDGTPIVAAVSDGSLRIHNRSDTPVFYFAHSEGALIQWHPVSGDENLIGPVKTVSIPLEEVAGFTEGRNILIHYWTELDPTNESVRQILVEPN